MRIMTKIQAELGSFNQPETEIEIHKDALLKNYARYNIEFVRGEGFYLFDKNGKRYLDFLSGIAVTGFGHNHPLIKIAVEEQLENLWHQSNLFESTPQAILAKKLTEKSGLDYVFFSNSGTEANEAAIKFARKFGKERNHIIAMVNGFHGRTMGSLSATGQYKVWEGFTPLTPGFIYVPFGDIDVLHHSINPHICAIMLEPIQGESGIIIPPKNYLKELRNFCDEHNLLLIFDEVQSGMGRTGKFFAHQWEEIKPDIITLAKGIANGIPLGATICSKKIGDEIKPGNHGSTFGGNPLAIAAANEVVNLLDEVTLLHIERMGHCLMNSIESLHNEKIKSIRGKGLMIGIELEENYSAKKAALILLEKGVVAGTSGEKVLRLLPPYIIKEKEIAQFTVTLDNVLNIL